MNNKAIKQPQEAATLETDVAVLTQRLEAMTKAYMTLSAEIWSLIDRQIILENVLEQSGNPISETVNMVIPEGPLKAHLDERRHAFVADVMTPFSPSETETN